MKKRSLISNEAYDVIKHITQIGLPAAAAFYAAIAQVWNLPYGPEVTSTISALVVMLSAFLGFSSAMYKPDGTIDYPKGDE